MSCPQCDQWQAGWASAMQEIEGLRATLADREAEAQATATELAKAAEGLRHLIEALRQLQAQLAAQRAGLLAREQALEEARALVRRLVLAMEMGALTFGSGTAKGEAVAEAKRQPWFRKQLRP